MTILSKLIQSKWFNLSVLMISFSLSLTVINKVDLIKSTLSAYGRENTMWFKFWGFFAGILILFNFRYIMHVFDIDNRVLYIFVILAFFCSLVTVNVIGLSLIERKIHNISAICFGLSSYACLIYIFLKAYLLKKARQIQLISLIIIGIAEIFFISIWRMNAASEIFLIVSMQIFIFSNLLVIKTSKSNEDLLLEENEDVLVNKV